MEQSAERALRQSFDLFSSQMQMHQLPPNREQGSGDAVLRGQKGRECRTQQIRKQVQHDGKHEGREQGDETLHSG